jgi:hypothetical protein
MLGRWRVLGTELVYGRRVLRGRGRGLPRGHLGGRRRIRGSGVLVLEGSGCGFSCGVFV